MIYFVSYDITSDKVRGKLFKFLKNYGIPVQKSVFELRKSSKEIEEIKKEINKKFKLSETDSIRFYKVCRECMKKVIVQGIGTKTITSDYYIV